MRRLKQIKLTYREKTGTSYKIVWEESAGGKLWEKHLLESSEYPRAELEEAVDDIGRFLVEVCALRLTAEQARRNVDVTRVAADYRSVRRGGYLSRRASAVELHHRAQWTGDAMPAAGRRV